MPEHAAHPDLAAHALAGLPPAEARAVEAHVAGCAGCRRELERLRATAALLERASAPFDAPADLERRTMETIARGALRPSPPVRNRSRITATAAVAAIAVALGVVVGVEATRESAPGGRLEFSATLRSPLDPALAAATTVRATSLGRDVALRSDSLPVLPTGEFYELWFVGPGDSTTRPNRISAGTFHPDSDGHSDLHLHAAADPSLFPTMTVTAEIEDGNPGPGREVLRVSR